MSSINLWTFSGRLGGDAETRDAGTGRVTTFSVAITDKYKDKADGTWKDAPVVWVRCEIWNRDAIAAYLKKGTFVAVSGRPKVSAYTNKEDEAVGSLECRVGEIEWNSPKEEAGY